MPWRAVIFRTVLHKAAANRARLKPRGNVVKSAIRPLHQIQTLSVCFTSWMLQ